MCFCLMQITDHSVFPCTFFKKHVALIFPNSIFSVMFGVLCVTVPCALCHSVILSTVIKDKLLWQLMS